MTRPRRRAAAVIVVLAAAVLVVVRMTREPEHLSARPPARRPALLLLTSLPLMFGEDFSLQGSGSPALKALETRYTVVPISVTDSHELARGGLLLMAQPRAQPAEDLVALDDWVRRGGRVMLLADPMLEWPSGRPLGDALRPPPMFADTGLLGHWGLRLDAPDERGVSEKKLGSYDVLTVSPGLLYGRCAISGDRLVANCRIGRGRAIIVADADLVDVDRLGRGSEHNLDALLEELAQLERL